jgi:hypothetical protein
VFKLWICSEDIDLAMLRLSARWVLCLITEDEMATRVAHSERFLKWYRWQGQQFRDRIITTDETWLYYYDPETKQQSSQWKNTDSPLPKKACASRSMGKHNYVYCVFQQPRFSAVSCCTFRSDGQCRLLLEGKKKK